MESIEHSQPYPSLSHLNPDIEKLKINKYTQTSNDKLDDFEFKIKGPHGINEEQFGEQFVYTLYWKHPKDSKAYCLWKLCCKNH